jgi:adenine-specific DNA-methyltransferase
MFKELFEYTDTTTENPDYLTKQIITYLGNKRKLLKNIGECVNVVQQKLNKNKLKLFDVFSGSGIVARYFKQYASLLIANDQEQYSKVLNECYLSNESELDVSYLQTLHSVLLKQCSELKEGIITELYSPKNDNDIKTGERVFYTHRNAMYIDTMRELIENMDSKYQKYFLAPLLTEASVHNNTSGIFKGFHKNKQTGLGQFGGGGEDALTRIKGNIELPYPIFSNFDCDYIVYNDDANVVIKDAVEVDLAYLDPPYNQHPYGSNYFMLNLILEHKRPQKISKISGIVEGWNKSDYNKKETAKSSLQKLVSDIKAKYVLLSFNSEGFITKEEIVEMLAKIGKTETYEINYNTFRGSRNLNNRNIHTKEYLFLLEK